MLALYWFLFLQLLQGCCFGYTVWWYGILKQWGVVYCVSKSCFHEEAWLEVPGCLFRSCRSLCIESTWRTCVSHLQSRMTDQGWGVAPPSSSQVILLMVWRKHLEHHHPYSEPEQEVQPDINKPIVVAHHGGILGTEVYQWWGDGKPQLCWWPCGQRLSHILNLDTY